MFTKELLIAVNDWQLGASARTKERKAERLRALAKALPAEFRSCDEPCYRQLALEKRAAFLIIVFDHLAEQGSAWTLSLEAAKQFKGGVAPLDNLHNFAIVKRMPQPDEVIINLDRLYREPQFLKAVDSAALSGVDLSAGIGRWQNTQSEVILDITHLDQRDIYLYGGDGSDVTTLARQYYGHTPSEAELTAFDALLQRGNIQTPIARWLSAEGTQKVLSRVNVTVDMKREDWGV